MALPQHYLAALLLPTGRINQFGFAILAIVIAVLNVFAWGAVRHTIVAFTTIWMTFCIMSRRLHDTGSTGFFLVPVLVLAIFAFLAALDPDIFGSEFRHNAVGILVIEQGVKFVRGLAIAGFMYCIKAGGQDGDNAYGPEFGDGPAFGTGARERRKAEAALERLQSYQEPQNSYRRVVSGSAPQWGSGRARQGFGRR
jgi:uncharacterized membrane protein YhaH (DUF805 family)